MSENPKRDLLIIGGGLAGLTAAARFARTGVDFALIDKPLSLARDRLGGFTRFSGAKFSFPPAGLGLRSICSSVEAFHVAISEVCALLGLAPYEIGSAHASSDVALEGNREVTLRSYRSIVLTPAEIDVLIDRLAAMTPPSQLVQGHVCRLSRNGEAWTVSVAAPSGVQEHSARTVLIASGRQGGELLLAAGAIPQPGKGLDIGVRVEFPTRERTKRLSELGPDAKIISDECRTFCLNSPGRVMRYQFEDFSIPGGVVAEPDWPLANVGLLVRVPGNKEAIARLRAAAKGLPRRALEHTYEYAAGFQLPEDLLTQLYGSKVVDDLHTFARRLETADLLDFRDRYYVHLPLLDWHWNVFGRPNSSKTTLEGVFVAGDIGGHARGLLQAAVAGWLAAAEILSRQ